jgi:hypothetical protein
VHAFIYSQRRVDFEIIVKEEDRLQEYIWQICWQFDEDVLTAEVI